MSILHHIFGKNTSELPQFWQKLESVEDLFNALEKSKERPVIIFKHSTRCFISKSVLKNFENDVESSLPKDIDFYFLDLLSHRNISNEIAQRLLVPHQSPQAILIDNTKAVYHSSHDQISLDSILKHLN